MKFDWDEAKDARCRAERGFGFADILPVFVDPQRLVELDTRHEYGETRHRLYGRIDGRLFVVVYTFRGKLIRIISARKANEREVRKHDQSEG
ncbi:BrnT family toxin [Azospirillum sp. SYSU D00513]|uniref:BrnT family toxin n=1 Tax=Azospirillum sp. SYSU D00513 TaxID=2812561 RepID=UPI001A978929|nr:BrnT family toxin [Azospirillum sp. SYSU D00513]